MPKIKAAKYYEGIGRRKSAIARVRLHVPSKEKVVTLGGLKVKQGELLVNKKAVDIMFPSASDKIQLLQPFHLTETLDRFAVTIQVIGGGKRGQLDASVLGIARALEKVDKDTFRPTLKKHRLLSRDARVRERRKVGTGGKARRQKQSPKR